MRKLRDASPLGPAGVAHDVNNLLTAILGDCGFALQSVRRDNRLRTMLEGVMNATEFAALLIRQLVAPGSSGIGSKQTLELGDVLEEMTGTLRAVLGSKIVLKVWVQRGSGTIAAVPGDLARLILNLAFNARDAMPEGGTFTLTVARAAQGEKRSGRRQSADGAGYVLLTASDTGWGMNKKTQAHLFVPSFSTKDSSTTARRGIGLATIQEVVKAAGGFIEVRSQPNRGATFRIYFPRLRTPRIDADTKSRPGDSRLEVADARTIEGVRSSSAGHTAAETLNSLASSSPGFRDGSRARHSIVPPSQQRSKILVVEDNEGVRRSVCRTLEMCGHRVVASASAREALEVAACAHSPIHLLVTDAELSGANGLELAKRLRIRHPETKVLLTSGHPYRPHLVQGMVVSFLQKPFGPQALARKVSEILKAPG